MPVEHTLRLITEALDLADRLAHHLKGIFRIDLIDRQLRIPDQQARGKFVEVVASTAVPVECLADATLFAIDNFIHANFAVRISMFPQFYANPASAHFMGYSCCGSRSKKRI